LHDDALHTITIVICSNIRETHTI